MMEHEITRAYRILTEATQRKREADYDIGEARNYLKDHIPAGTSIAEVFHSVHQKVVIHYADAVEKIIMGLVPKGCRVKAWEVIGSYTHTDTCHSFNRGGN